MTYRHGLTIGKFSPPHLGHGHLIARACAEADVVTVLVLAAQTERIPLDLRVRVLRQMLRDAGVMNARVIGVLEDGPVDFTSDAAWDAHLAVDHAALASDEGIIGGVTGGVTGGGVTGDRAFPPVDAVFSSEAYGDELARRFGATHVLVDAERSAVPVRATDIRAALTSPWTAADAPARRLAWSQLAPAGRAALTRRVCLVGAESTGKTTLARALAAHHETVWVPEYGRFYSERRAANAAAGGRSEPAWRDEEFALIARQQQFDEDEHARTAGPVLVCDTDAFATGIWQARYTGHTSWDVTAAGRARTYTAYLLTSPDGVGWEDDGLRDGQSIRTWMHQQFLDGLAARCAVTGEPWQLLTGSPEQRLAAAVAFLEPLLPLRL